MRNRGAQRTHPGRSAPASLLKPSSSRLKARSNSSTSSRTPFWSGLRAGSVSKCVRLGNTWLPKNLRPNPWTGSNSSRSLDNNLIESWQNTITYLAEINHKVRAYFINHHPLHCTFDPAAVSSDGFEVAFFSAERANAHFAANALSYARMMAEYIRRYLRRGAKWGRIINISTERSPRPRGFGQLRRHTD